MYHANARKHYSRRRFQEEREKQAAEQEAEQLAKHLKAAANMMAIKKRGPVDYEKLSYPAQVDLLEAYVLALQAEAEEFAETWGSAGKDGVRWIQTEIQSVLKDIALLKITILQGERQPRGVL